MKKHDEKTYYLLDRAGYTEHNVKYSDYGFELHHRFPKARSGKAKIIWERNYKNFGDSVINLQLIKKDKHATKNTGTEYYNDRQAKLFEKILKNRPDLSKLVNVETGDYEDVDSAVYEVMQIYDQIISNKKCDICGDMYSLVEHLDGQDRCWECINKEVVE